MCLSSWTNPRRDDKEQSLLTVPRLLLCTVRCILCKDQIYLEANVMLVSSISRPTNKGRKCRYMSSSPSSNCVSTVTRHPQKWRSSSTRFTWKRASPSAARNLGVRSWGTVTRPGLSGTTDREFGHGPHPLCHRQAAAAERWGLTAGQATAFQAICRYLTTLTQLQVSKGAEVPNTRST